ncbi:uncharacterized protein LOC125539971 isoform X3 [Triticum urartu]|uniref:uncharacterized protein LOC125539971 isoform X2 n=1 Tax=Triticum urartu TaxID=4572 RepID=UPI0020445E01|nr:uncharacterized protein LOC125539971 isoform X2 [Triticum urartu]XP_048559484.1 uncharacterized protein LOC125539971 isoform X3 [Triticum urartu]
MVVGRAAGGATGGGKKKDKFAGGGASSSLTREEREDMLDALIEKEVQKRMNKFKGKRRDKFELSVEDAGLRLKIAKEEQTSLSTLPRFELDIDCDILEYINLLKDRMFHHRTRGSYYFGGGVVATPPMGDDETFNMIEFMETTQRGSKRSVMQCIFCDNDLYYQLFRATPEKDEDRYTKGNFYRLGGAKRVFPESLFGELKDLEGAPESYHDVEQIAVYANVFRKMVEKVKKLKKETAKKFDPDRLPLVQLPIVAVCESERFPAVLRFTTGNFYSSTPQHVTSTLRELVHNWGRLSKLAFLMILAVIEFDMGYYDCRKSFNEARANLHNTVRAVSTLELDFRGPDGHFGLKKLLGVGGCVHVLKFEFDDVICIIMRARHDARGAIREIRAKLDISTAGADVELAGADAKKVISSHERKEAQTRELAGVRAEADDAARADVKKTQAKVSVLTPSDGADVNELQTKVPVPTTSRSLVELAGADAKKVISSHERKEAQTRAVPPDEVEWARWQKCRRAGLKVMDLLME